MNHDVSCPAFRESLKRHRRKLLFAINKLQKDYPDYEEVKNALGFLTGEINNLTINDLPLLLLVNFG